MMLLDGLIQSGLITLVMLAILVAEALVYIFYVKRLRRMIATLAAGASLVLALRASLLQHSNIEIAGFLALSFVFHLMEVWQWLKMSKHQPQ
jgi:hypothetical protein